MENQYPGTNHPDCIIVHHTAYPGMEPQFDLVNEWHKERQFPLSTLGFYVGYQFFIEKDGTVHQARAETEGGAHTIGKNWSSIGICLAGDFSTESPTSLQVDALETLMHKLCDTLGILPTEIFPHRHFNNTTCYGTILRDEWAQVLMSPITPPHIEEMQNMLDSAENV